MVCEFYLNISVFKNYPSLDDKLCGHLTLPHFYLLQMSFKMEGKKKISE